MGSRLIIAAVAAELSIFAMTASGCASSSTPQGFGGSWAPAPTPLGTYLASGSMTQQYGITEWRTYFGKNQMVVTGYRADGTAARGVQFAWFASAPESTGHTRLMMLDGTGAVLRRMVGGGESGHLSNTQIALIQTMRSDLAMGRQPANGTVHGSSLSLRGSGGSLHLLDDSSGPTYGTSPNQGPQCFEASNDPSIVLDGSGCIVGAATFETVVGGMMAMGTCAQWYLDMQKAQMTCNNENSTYCNNDTPPTCSYGQDPSAPVPAPQSQCDQACICANYGVYNGMPCSQTCVDNSACSSGQECHWGSCGPAAAASDSPTNQNVSQQNPAAPSCDSGDVTANPSNGQVGCSNGGGAGGSGGSSGGGSGSSSGTDTGNGDPTSGSSGSSSSSGGSGSGGTGAGGQCAGDGAACAQDSDCCLGSCNAGACGVSGDGSSSSGGGSGSSSGGGCAADGAACTQDSDCCGGTCDTSSGTCGSGGSSSSSSGGSGSGSSSGGGCSADGSGCAQDSDCCSGTCDTSTGTCGSSGGSSSGGSSGSSSGGGCAPDGDPCAQASDCCSGACTAGTCGSGAACGNPGDGCGQDSDCCSGSCDTSTGTCN